MRQRALGAHLGRLREGHELDERLEAREDLEIGLVGLGEDELVGVLEDEGCQVGRIHLGVAVRLDQLQHLVGALLGFQRLGERRVSRARGSAALVPG